MSLARNSVVKPIGTRIVSVPLQSSERIWRRSVIHLGPCRHLRHGKANTSE